MNIIIATSRTNINVEMYQDVFYSYESGIYGGSANNTISIITDDNLAIGKAMSIQQGMALANRYMYTLENNYLAPVTVKISNELGTSAYNGDDGKIYLLQTDAYDWDVLEHEYGHYVQAVYNFRNNFGLEHYSNVNIADNYNSKPIGVKLAWGEGWATYFAINLQNKMNAIALNIPNVGDTCYQDTEDISISYDIEYLPIEYHLGEANEATVAAVLYDITDPTNAAEADFVSIANNTVWNITKSNHCLTLSGFISALNSTAYIPLADKVKIGEILSHYAVAALLEMPTITDDGVTFSWIKQGGSTRFENNSFRLIVFNEAFSVIYTTNYTNSDSLVVPLSQWNNLLSTANTLHCCIQTRQTTSPTTGPYYSNYIDYHLAR